MHKTLRAGEYVCEPADAAVNNIGIHHMNIVSKIPLAIAWALLAAGAPAFSASVAEVVNQVSKAQYQDYLDNKLYTHKGDERASGPQHDLALTNIYNALAGFGLQTKIEPFTYENETCHNVVAVLPGSTARSNEVYLVAGHYDSAQTAEGLGVPGADDDASGVAGMLEAARVLSKYRFGATLVFAAFDREEDGLVGSAQYVATHAAQAIKGMLALDMIANNNTPDQPEIYCQNPSKPMMLALSNSVALYGQGLQVKYGGPEDRADHYSFEQGGFQACLLFEGGNNTLYHKLEDSTDTPGYIDYDFATKLTRSAVGWLAAEAQLYTPAPLAIPAIAAAEAVTSTNFLAVWHPVPGATNYILQVSTTAAFAAADLAPGYDHVNAGSDTNWLVEDLTPGTKYFYRVQAQDDQTVSGFSSAANVQTLPGSSSGGDNSWTILVYGHGDHNLSSSLIMDMNEMEQAGSGKDFNIVVQADFNASEPNEGLPKELASGVTRFLMQKDGDTENITSPAVERLAEANNMDDPKTLTDFVTWAITKYPARRYGLVLWDHGGQWIGFGGDTQDGTVENTGTLTTAQIRQALASAMQATGVAKWEFISFDTCLMGGAEILSDMVPLTDVFIADAELDYGDGWEYGAALGYLKANPGTSALDFGIQEVKTWRDHHMRADSPKDLALAAHAAYDLTRFSDFSQKFNAFGVALNQSATAQSSWIPQAVLETTHYDISKIEESGQATDFLDLGEFAQKLAANPSASAGLKTAAEALVSSIQSLVAAKVVGAAKTNSLGLSVYYPVAGSKDNQAYLGLSFSQMPNASWPAYLATVAQIRAGDTTPPKVTETGSGGSGATVYLTASAQQPAVIRFTTGADNDQYAYRAAIVDRRLASQTNGFVFLGEVAFTQLKAAGDQSFQWSCSLPVLSVEGGSGTAFLGGFFDDPSGKTMTSYASYSPPGSQDNFRVALISEINADGSGRLIGALDADTDNGNLAPEGIELEPGGILKPVYYMERRPDAAPANWVEDLYISNTALTIPATGLAGVKWTLQPLPNGVYDLELRVQDNFGNVSVPMDYQITIGASVPSPKLQIASVAGGSVKIAWPAAAAGFVPQVSTDLKAAWADLPTADIAAEGDNSVLILPKSAGAHFYRLIKK